MNEEQNQRKNLVDTTDCLEAVGVFRGWKNFLFVIILLCLVLLQGSFWLVNTGYIKAEIKTEAAETTLPAIEPPAVITPPPAKELVVPLEESKRKQSVGKPNKIEKLAKKAAAAAPNQPAEAPKVQPQPQQTRFLFGIKIKFKQLARFIRFLDFVLILAAILYCLTMLFGLKVSLLGRLGGINHICRAFFLSLVFVVLLLPWQRFFAGVVAGAIYTPGELLKSFAAAETSGTFGTILHYLRFTGYWLVVLLLLILSQLRSGRWAKAILHRLEVM